MEKVSDMNTKIVPLQELSSRLEPHRQAAKRIVHSHGCFDLVHPGHIKHLQAAKREGDMLVVTLVSDRFVNKGPGRPVFPHDVRAEMIAALGCVDFVAIHDDPSVASAISSVRPHVYSKGSEDITAATEDETVLQEERKAVETVGARFHTTYEPSWSSSSLLNRHFDVFPEDTRAFLGEFRKRFTVQDVMSGLEKIRPLRVLLIGDAVIDEYQYVRSMGKTSKANVIATHLLETESFAGGIFACANHVASFCDTVHIVTSLGRKNTQEAFIRERLKPNVTMHAIYRDGMPTTVKRRFLDANFLSKLFEVYDFDDTPLNAKEQSGLDGHLKSVLPDYDVVICLDYLHGLISIETAALLAKHAKFLAVNTQTNAANVGYNPVTRYPRADYVCIDEPEMRLAMLDRKGPVDSLLVQVAQKLASPKAIGTRGHRGCLAYEAGRGLFPVPVLSRKVVDAVGAGDAFLAVTAPLVAAGLPMELVGFIGNVVGSQAVMIVGNRESVESAPLLKAIKALLA